MEVFYCCRPVPSGIGKEYWEIIQANEKAGINESPSVGTHRGYVRFRQQSETKGGEIPPFNCWGVFISDCCRGIGKAYWEIIQANEKAGINNSPSVGTYPRCVRFHRQSETKGGEIQPFNCWVYSFRIVVGESDAPGVRPYARGLYFGYLPFRAELFSPDGSLFLQGRQCSGEFVLPA